MIGCKAEKIVILLQHMGDRLIRFVGAEAEFRGSVVSMAETANTLFQQHKPSPEMGEYLCDVATTAVLFASNIKKGAISIHIESSGIIGMIKSDATPDGFVRAMIPKMNIEDEETSKKLKLPMLGQGTFSVVKKMDESSPPYKGVIELSSPFIGPNAAIYMLSSEQIKSSLSVSTQFLRNNVEKCFGFYIEALPKLLDNDLKTLENNIVRIGDFKEFIDKIKQPEELLEELSAGHKIDIIRETPIRSFCPCTSDRVMKAIAAVGQEEVEKIIHSGLPLEVFCDYCRKRYEIPVSALQNVHL